MHEMIVQLTSNSYYYVNQNNFYRKFSSLHQKRCLMI